MRTHGKQFASLLTLSICAEWPGRDEDPYLIALQTPAPGATCQQDEVPFSG